MLTVNGAVVVKRTTLSGGVVYIPELTVDINDIPAVTLESKFSDLSEFIQSDKHH